MTISAILGEKGAGKILLTLFFHGCYLVQFNGNRLLEKFDKTLIEL